MVAEQISKTLQEVVAQVEKMEEENQKLKKQLSDITMENWALKEQNQKEKNDKEYWKNIALKVKEQ